jgi:putative heme degradation protein
MGLLVHWIEHKYDQAVRRKEESTIKLDLLSKMINPFVSPRSTYDLRFFEEQWNHQRQFQLTHTDADRERQERLAMFLDQEASLNRLRYVMRH